MMSTHILVPLGVDLNTRAECVARLFAGLVLGRPLHVMHVMCGTSLFADDVRFPMVDSDDVCEEHFERVAEAFIRT